MATELSYKPVNGPVIGQDINVSKSTQMHDLGTLLRDKFGREFMYVIANGAVTGQGYTCAVDSSYDATLLTTAIANTLSRFMGPCATNGAPEDDDYMWLCMSKPPGDTEMGIWTAASAAADAQLYTTSTAGQLATATANAPIDNVRLLTATGGSAAVNTASEWHYMARGLAGT